MLPYPAPHGRPQVCFRIPPLRYLRLPRRARGDVDREAAFVKRLEALVGFLVGRALLPTFNGGKEPFARAKAFERVVGHRDQLVVPAFALAYVSQERRVSTMRLQCAMNLLEDSELHDGH